MNTAEDTQQFCLRWHNYQSSLLATLPALLDGDDLTDVTLCAGSRTIKAHRVVLSACSEYFKELFKEIGPSHHPVIVLPNVEFTDLCALVTFMYSGEVNIYESQLASLLVMADMLHIKGLADFSNTTNISSKHSRPKRPRMNETAQDYVTTKPNRMATTTTSTNKRPPSLSETAEVFADCYMPTMMPMFGASGNMIDLNANNAAPDANIVHDLSKRIAAIPPSSHHHHDNINNDQPSTITTTTHTTLLDGVGAGNNNNNNNSSSIMAADVKRLEYAASFTYKLENFTANISSESSMMTNSDDTAGPTDLTQGSSESTYKPTKGGGSGLSKMYTTCYICGKQLSNHYNLRVHMETHQNVQYACSACNHVSRSRDALRKHVSYRHPPAIVPPAPVTGPPSSTSSTEGNVNNNNNNNTNNNNNNSSQQQKMITTTLIGSPQTAPSTTTHP